MSESGPFRKSAIIFAKSVLPQERTFLRTAALRQNRSLRKRTILEMLHRVLIHTAHSTAPRQLVKCVMTHFQEANPR
jgi:hypothetical protein